MSKLITTSSHGKGFTCLTFSKDGQRAFTGGRDCIVRIWKVDDVEEQEPSTVVDAEDAITCLAAVDDYWFSGSEDTEVRRYLRDSNEFDAPLTSVAGVPVRDVAVDLKGRKVAVASDELFVRVINMEDSSQSTRLEGYRSGVRSATWHPSGNLLTTCTCDGKIVVWNMTLEPPSIEKTLEGIIPAVIDTESPEFLYDCSVVWHTSGQYFFVATKGHEIITIARSDWSKSSTFSDKNVSGSITALALSPNGVYLASASQSRVHIWSTQTRRVLVSQNGNLGSTITQLQFSPRDNFVAWTDSDGVFSRWVKPISDDFPDPVKVSVSATNTTIPIQRKPGLDFFLDTPSTEQEKDAEADIDLDAAMMDDGWIVDDMDGAHKAEVPESKRDPFVKEMVSITKAQPPFQPGSTPFLNKKRYLAYNLTGVIESTDQDTHHVVNVEFFDKSLRKGFNFSDNYKYDLAYLGERGAVFACQPENEHPARVYFRPYSNRSTTAWHYTLTRSGTRCLGVAVGGLPLTSQNDADIELEGYGQVVVATSEHDLTFLSGTGRERRIMALPGEFVTMAASAEWVFVVHRAGSTTIDGSQSLHFTIINFEDFSVRQRDVLPVPKGHTLKWIGLTDQGAPAMYDSTGYLHVLTKHRIPHHGSWARVLDTNLLERRKGKDESYWAVGINGGNFMCLILKGRQEYPSFPRPLIQELPLQIPFRNDSSQEEMIARESLQIDMMLDALDEELTTDDIVSREKAMDKEFVKLVQVACKDNNIPRAIELTKLLHHTTAFDFVIQIADFYHLPGLKEKLVVIKTEREEAEDRLIVARNKRRRWLKPEPPLRHLMESSTSMSRFDPLADNRPPPMIERPGMARVTVPIVEKPRYSSLVPPTRAQEPISQDDQTVVNSSPSEDTKRKRDLQDDSYTLSQLPPPKQKINPFARKANPDTNKNPFARKLEAKSIQKSDSFFDKVDAAESAPRKTRTTQIKAAAKRDGPKQATLFGMMSKTAPPKPSEIPPPSDVMDEDEEIQLEETQIDSQMTDMTMTDTGSLGNFETQDTQQRSYSPDWDESLFADESSEMAAVA